MKLFSLMSALIFISNIVYGQSDSLNVNEYIYNRVFKNITAFYITYQADRKKDLTGNGFLTQGIDKYFFDEALPNEGYKLDMQITKLSFDYPIKDFIVYQVKLDGLRFTSESRGKSKSSLLFDGPFDAPPSNYYLLCVNQRQEIKFISGNYFVNDITCDFGLDKANPKSYLLYLKYRTFTYKTNRIAFIKRRKNLLYFSAYSEELNRMISITLNTATPGLLKLGMMN